MKKLVWIFVFAVMVAGCAESEQATVQDGLPEPVEANVGLEGGDISAVLGGEELLAVTIPAGALDEEETITIDPLPDDTTLPSSTSGGDPVDVVGLVYDMGPSGTVFKAPVRLTFAYDLDALGDIDPQSLRIVTLSNGELEILSDTILDTSQFTVSGTTLHFSPFGVVAIQCDPAEGDAACDDGNECTINTCNGSGRCVTTPAQGTCDDDNACTGNDTCSQGVCAGIATVCDAAPGECYDSAGVCNTVSGECMYALEASTVACSSDNDDCTEDFCDGEGVCAHTFVCECQADEDCDDANTCTDDSCNGSNVCVNTPATGLCGTLGYCSSGACVECDDGNPCTDDEATVDGCVNDADNLYGDCCTAADGADGICDPDATQTTGICTPIQCMDVGPTSGGYCSHDQCPCMVDSDCSCPQGSCY